MWRHTHTRCLTYARAPLNALLREARQTRTPAAPRGTTSSPLPLPPPGMREYYAPICYAIGLMRRAVELALPQACSVHTATPAPAIAHCADVGPCVRPSRELVLSKCWRDAWGMTNRGRESQMYSPGIVSSLYSAKGRAGQSAALACNRRNSSATQGELAKKIAPSS